MEILGGRKGGSFAQVNVVPLIDILLVLLVIFMVIPNSEGIKAEIPRRADIDSPQPESPAVVVQVLANGSLQINQQPVEWQILRDRLEQIFNLRGDRTAFVSGDAAIEFEAIARVIDTMHAAGVASVGLLTSLE